jgi:hypothetical protein
VSFAGISGVPGGHVQVSAYGGSGFCKIVSWGFPSGHGVTVNVKCFSATGVAQNSRYTVAYFRYTGTGPSESAYVWDNLNTSSGTPHGTYQWAASGGTVTSRRVSAGSYEVTFPFLPASKTSVLVTAYGLDSVFCRSDSGGGATATTTTLAVKCLNSSGQPADSMFTLAFGHTLIHSPSWAWTSCATVNFFGCGAGFVHIGADLNQSNIALGSRLTSGGVGRYVVELDKILPLNSSIALVATGASINPGPETRCQVVSWGQAFSGRFQEDVTRVEVSCFDYTGQLKDGAFILNFGATHQLLE